MRVRKRTPIDLPKRAGCYLEQQTGWLAPEVRVDHRHPLAELLHNYSDGFSEVRIIGHDHSLVKVASKNVQEQMRREIHVRPFLFGFQNLDRLRGSRGRKVRRSVGQWELESKYRVREEEPFEIVRIGMVRSARR